MVADGLDELDRYIIHSLQLDARNTPAREIAEAMDVSPSTVRNRIHRLEEEGYVRGYHLDIDYERAGFQLYTLIICTAPIPDRERLAQEAVEVPGVVSVREIMTGAGNVHIVAVGTDSDDLSRIGQDLNALGFEIVDEDIVRNEYSHPYHGFAGDDSRSN
ncbi:Lrp/AsnC family transcriptional regulator [Halegenticoccus tardaugens]|uniref:Lrp/AsnC family transcriptional regulator n=1 Tax=Halegenticoccus tardaugens TaxID=2071624 RepID=UPI00100A8D5C|nr:Lrp/AsnC family transcriptional regulator [Halegenticoccus tardaugens]